MSSLSYRNQQAMTTFSRRWEASPVEDEQDEEDVTLADDAGSNTGCRYIAADGTRTTVAVDYTVSNDTVTVTGAWIEHATWPAADFSAERLKDWAQQIDDELRSEVRMKQELDALEARFDREDA